MAASFGSDGLLRCQAARVTAAICLTSKRKTPRASGVQIADYIQVSKRHGHSPTRRPIQSRSTAVTRRRKSCRLPVTLAASPGARLFSVLRSKTAMATAFWIRGKLTRDTAMPLTTMESAAEEFQQIRPGCPSPTHVKARGTSSCNTITCTCRRCC